MSSGRDTGRGGAGKAKGSGGGHADLFQPASSARDSSGRQDYQPAAPQDQQEILDDYSPHIQDQLIHETYGAGDYQEDPLQLEHVVGFGADSPTNLCSLPLNEYTIAKG
jgi:hypothetical protein